MRMRFLLSVAFAAFVSFGANFSAEGQGRDAEWSRLASLTPGTRVIVDRDGNMDLKGRFVRSNDGVLTVRSSGKEIELLRSEVAAVYLARRSSRIKRGLIGGLAGAGAGLLIGAVTVAATKGDPLIGAGGFLIGIPAGAAIGAATGGGSKKGELIYSR